MKTRWDYHLCGCLVSLLLFYTLCLYVAIGMFVNDVPFFSLAHIIDGWYKFPRELVRGVCFFYAFVVPMLIIITAASESKNKYVQNALDIVLYIVGTIIAGIIVTFLPYLLLFTLTGDYEIQM